MLIEASVFSNLLFTEGKVHIVKKQLFFKMGLLIFTLSYQLRDAQKNKKVEKQKERERRETAKVGMTVKVGQLERDGQKVKVGTHQVKVGSKKDQQE